MKKLKKETHIVVLMGGISEEREVSLETGKRVFEALKNDGYKNVETLDMNRLVGKELEERNPDVVFNALHGTYGEDGRIQGMLDIMNIPYTGSGVTASAIAMDKIYSRAFMKHLDISCAEAKIMTLSEGVKPPFSFPFVVKDPRNGSSRGVFIVDKMEKWNEAVEYFSERFPVVVECFFSGREINVTVMNDSVIGDVEVIPANDFYDYESKYLSDETRYVVSPDYDESVKKDIQDAALKFHRYIGCTGATRSDFIVRDSEYIMLELNTLPGMTAHSLVPMIGESAGYSFIDIVKILIEEAMK